MKTQIHGLLMLLPLCFVGAQTQQFNRTLRSSSDCNNINSLTRTGGYINWNGAYLWSCSIEVFSNFNILDDVCVQMKSINIQDCSVKIEFITNVDVVKKVQASSLNNSSVLPIVSIVYQCPPGLTHDRGVSVHLDPVITSDHMEWTCLSSSGGLYCTSSSFPKIRVTTPAMVSGFSNYFSLKVYASRDSFSDLATTTVSTAYSLIGIVIGVIVGVIVLIVVIIVAVCVCCCRQTGGRTQGHVIMQPVNPQYPPQPGVYPSNP